jgi:hypothetical protein
MLEFYHKRWLLNTEKRRLSAVHTLLLMCYLWNRESGGEESRSPQHIVDESVKSGPPGTRTQSLLTAWHSCPICISWLVSTMRRR